MKAPVMCLLVLLLSSHALATEYSTPLPGCCLAAYPCDGPVAFECGSGHIKVEGGTCQPWIKTQTDFNRDGILPGVVDARVAFTIANYSCDSVRVLLEYQDREGRFRKIPMALAIDRGGEFRSENLARLRYPLRSLGWITTIGWGQSVNYEVKDLRLVIQWGDLPMTKHPVDASWGQVKGLYR